MRNLVKIVTLDDVVVHPNADALELALIGGWQVVVKKGEFIKGDRVVYFEVDSFLPKGNPNWDFLMQKSTKTFCGIEGHVLKTIRLRGYLSQGLVLPISILECVVIGDDLAETLGVIKYEKPLPTGNLDAKGSFPSWITKTDENRIQNLKKEVETDWMQKIFYVTEKLDGSSFTAYFMDGEFGVCSRNQSLKLDVSNPWTDIAKTLDLENRLKEVCSNQGIESLVIQGELIGSGMNGNKYKLADRRLYLFTVYINGKRLGGVELSQFCDMYKFDQVPLLGTHYGLTVEEQLNRASALRSAINPNVLAEGYVSRSVLDSNISYKVISNEWLLEYKE